MCPEFWVHITKVADIFFESKFKMLKTKEKLIFRSEGERGVEMKSEKDGFELVVSILVSMITALLVVKFMH